MQVLFDVKAVQDLEALGKEFRRRVPDPGRAIAEHDTLRSLAVASPGGFPQHPFGEVGSVGTAVRSGRAFDGGRVADRSLIPHRRALLIPRFGRPYGDQLGLAGLRRAIRLLARASSNFGGA